MRKLENKLIELLDSVLLLNGFVIDAIEEKKPRLIMVEAAKALVGVREKTNKNDGEIVELIQKTCNGKKGHAWCMYFVQTCIAYAELKTGLKSRVYSSGSCASVWYHSDDNMRVKYHPLSGAIVIWVHKDGSGHTGIYTEDNNNIMTCIEGNTTSGFSPSEKIIREGGGVYVTKREMNPKGEMKIRGFLKPF